MLSILRNFNHHSPNVFLDPMYRPIRFLPQLPLALFSFNRSITLPFAFLLMDFIVN